jgi:type I restriction-modification system DNA methylase subunit
LRELRGRLAMSNLGLAYERSALVKCNRWKSAASGKLAFLGFDCFFGELATSEGQGGGELSSPASIVQLLAQAIDPFDAQILDQACGLRGMFVPPVAEHHQNPAAELATCGVEKADETGRPALLNLALHGPEASFATGPTVTRTVDSASLDALHFR